MIKTLKSKYVFNSMLAISVLLLILLGVINTVNILSVKKQMRETLRIISDMGGKIDNLPPRELDKPRQESERNPIGQMKTDYDVFMSSNFFVVEYDENKEVKFADVSRTSAISEDVAKEFANQVLQSGKREGKIGTFRFAVSDGIGTGNYSVVGLDTSGEIRSYLRVLLLSIAGGIACWGGMLIFVLFLSERAIKPIAENMEKQKQFITDAGHEIKTPLAIIQANTEAMELYNGENKWSHNIKEQTQRLSGLMQNLLLLAKMDEETIVMQTQEVAFSTMLETSVEQFKTALQLRNIQCHVKIEDGLIVKGDEQKLLQLLSILLDNANKYTNSNGEVWVRLERSLEGICMQIENTTDDLLMVDTKRLFDRFYRADAARTQKKGGYGIGLSAAKSIVEMHKGRIEASYIEKNRICFEIIL